MDTQLKITQVQNRHALAYSKVSYSIDGSFGMGSSFFPQYMTMQYLDLPFFGLDLGA